MWAEHHMVAGASLYGLAAVSGEPSTLALTSACLLAVASHPVLDGLNYTPPDMVYHGIGEDNTIKALSSLLRAPIWLVLFRLIWIHPLALVPILCAWLVFDLEEVTKLWGWKGNWLHSRMWPKWLRSQWGLIPVLSVLILGTIAGV